MNRACAKLMWSCVLHSNTLRKSGAQIWADYGRARWSCVGPETALDLVFSTVEYRPATVPTRALRNERARRRGLMTMPTVAERLDQGAPRFSRRLNFDRGTRCCCLRLIERTDFTSLTAISAARVPRSVPVSSWSWSRAIKATQNLLVWTGHGALQLWLRLLPSDEMLAASARPGCGGMCGVWSGPHAEKRPSRASRPCYGCRT